MSSTPVRQRVEVPADNEFSMKTRDLETETIERLPGGDHARERGRGAAVTFR
jgi:hypothetical protein